MAADSPTHTSPGVIRRELFRLAAPIIGLNVLAVITLAVDTVMCGQLPNSEDALTALGFATQLVWLLLVAMMGLVVGTVALIARAHGGGDHERVAHLVRQSTMLTVIIGVVMGGLGFLFSRHLLLGLGATPNIAEIGASYLRPLMLGATFYYLAVLYTAMCRGVGNTRLPFLVALASNALNIVINYGLILGNWGMPSLGVQGAGIGTAVSLVFNVVVVVMLLRRGAVPGLVIRLRPKKIDKALAIELFRIGFPAALDMVILNAAFLSIVGMLGRIDAIAVAAHGIGLRIQALAFVPGLGVSQATGALVGQALGASNIERARQITRASIVLSTAMMTFLALAIVVAASPIVSVFDVASGSELESYSVMWMRLLGYGMPVVGVHIALIGLFQGAGATPISLRINFLGTVLFQIPVGAILAFPLGMGAMGLWLSFPLSFVIKVILSYRAYRGEAWAIGGITLHGNK